MESQRLKEPGKMLRKTKAVAAALLVGRLGSSLANPAINTTAISALGPEQMRQGAGVINLFLMFGGSSGISIYVIVLELRTEFHADTLTATQTSGNETTAALLRDVSATLSRLGLPDATQYGAAMHYLDSVITAQANALGFQDGFILLTVVALAPMLPVAYLLRTHRS